MELYRSFKVEMVTSELLAIDFHKKFSRHTNPVFPPEPFKAGNTTTGLQKELRKPFGSMSLRTDCLVHKSFGTAFAKTSFGLNSSRFPQGRNFK